MTDRNLIEAIIEAKEAFSKASVPQDFRFSIDQEGNVVPLSHEEEVNYNWLCDLYGIDKNKGAL